MWVKVRWLAITPYVEGTPGTGPVTANSLSHRNFLHNPRSKIERGIAYNTMIINVLAATPPCPLTPPALSLLPVLPRLSRIGNKNGVRMLPKR